MASESSHWIPVGHDVDEQDLPPLKALSGAIIHADDQKRRTGQEFADEALSDAASFVEIGRSATMAVIERSTTALGDNVFSYISAAAAIYLLSHIHKEGVRQEGILKRTLELLDEYMKAPSSAVLHKAGLELEQVPDIRLNAETRKRTITLLQVHEIGDRVANTDKSAAKIMADKLVSFINGTRHALAQTVVNAYYRNPKNVGNIFMSAVNATRVSLRLLHLKVSGNTEVNHDQKNGALPLAAELAEESDEPVDLSDVMIEGMEQGNIATFDPKVLEESLHIDTDYQSLLKQRVKFLQLTVIQGIFIGASITQGVYNALKGDAGWSFVNFSSASAASGPFKFFADTVVNTDALLRTRRAEVGHTIATLAGREHARDKNPKQAFQDQSGAPEREDDQTIGHDPPEP